VKFKRTRPGLAKVRKVVRVALDENQSGRDSRGRIT